MVKLTKLDANQAPETTISTFPNGSILKREYRNNGPGPVKKARINGENWKWDGYCYVSENGGREGSIRKREELPAVTKITPVRK